MTDYQRVVEYLRDVRLQPNKVVTDDLRSYATEFAELCKQANDRLRQCSTFLGQGLRSEAIHLADESPNLLDMVAALDLPEPDAWVEYCQQHDLPVPEQLQMDRANQLNEAYAQDQPLEHLLNRHRLLALSRAPIKERLDTLRQISAQDPGGTLWEKSIRTFEKARLREMPADFLNSVKSKDPQAIRSLYTEINQPWLEPVPADLQNGVTEAFGRLQRQSVENTLRELVKPLRDAFAARAYGEAASLVQKWRNILSDANVTSLSADLSQEVEPVIDWLKEEDELRSRHKAFVAACRSFTGLLDATAPEAELDAAHEKLKRFDEPIPEAIEARYQDVVKKRVQAVSRAHRVRLAMVAGAVVLVLGVIGVAALMNYRGNAAKTWTARIVKATADKDIALALSLVADQEKQAGWLNSDPDLAQAKKQAEQLAEDAKRDKLALSDQLKALSDALTKASPATNSQKPEELLAALATVNDALHVSAARDLSWVDTDKKLPEALAAVQSLHQQLAEKVANTVAEDVALLGKQLDALPPSDQDNPDIIIALGTITSKARAIQNLTGLDDSTKGAVAGLLTRADALQKEYGKHRDENEALRRIRTTATTAEDLAKSLQDFIKRFPDSPLTSEFTSALDRSSFDKSVEVWRDLQATWANPFVAISANMAQKRTDEVQNYLTNQPGSPMTDPANTYLAYLKAASDALAPKGTWQSGQNGFGDLLSSPLMTELAAVQTNKGRTFYTIGNINRQEHKLEDQVTTTFDVLDAKTPGKKKQVTLSPPEVIATGPTPAPHTHYAAELVEAIKFIDEKNWETFGIDVVERLRKDEDMDLVVRASLIEQAVKGTDAAAHWALGDTYERTIADFSRMKLGDIVWFDRDNPVPELTLASLRRVIDNVPKGELVKQKIADRKAELFKTLAFNYTSTGVLLKDGQGNWILQPVGASDGTIAWAVSPIPAGAVVRPVAAAASPPPVVPTVPPATDPAASAPASSPAGATDAAPAPDAGAVAPAPPPAAAAATPTAGISTNLVRVAEFKGNAFVVDPNAAKNLPQGTLVFITKP